MSGYYELFPPKDMNVSTQISVTTDAQGNKTSRRILVAEKDFAAGEVIYRVNVNDL
jgi:mitochondrial import receptor subunit TOM20